MNQNKFKLQLDFAMTKLRGNIATAIREFENNVKQFSNSEITANVTLDISYERGSMNE